MIKNNILGIKITLSVILAFYYSVLYHNIDINAVNDLMIYQNYLGIISFNNFQDLSFEKFTRSYAIGLGWPYDLTLACIKSLGLNIFDLQAILIALLFIVVSRNISRFGSLILLFAIFTAPFVFGNLFLGLQRQLIALIFIVIMFNDYKKHKKLRILYSLFLISISSLFHIGSFPLSLVSILFLYHKSNSNKNLNFYLGIFLLLLSALLFTYIFSEPITNKIYYYFTYRDGNSYPYLLSGFFYFTILPLFFLYIRSNRYKNKMIVSFIFGIYLFVSSLFSFGFLITIDRIITSGIVLILKGILENYKIKNVIIIIPFIFLLSFLYYLKY